MKIYHGFFHTYNVRKESSIYIYKYWNWKKGLITLITLLLYVVTYNKIIIFLISKVIVNFTNIFVVTNWTY